MANLDITTGANFIPELWADPIYKYFKRLNKLRGSVDDYSSMVKGQGDTIHIPKIALKAAVSKVKSTEITFGTAGTVGKVDLSIDKHYVVPELFEDIALIQSNFELISKYTKMMGESIARQVDENMWDELDGFQTRQDLSANNTFAANDLETTLGNLYASDLDPNMCSMAVNRLILADIMHPSSGVASYFVRADAVGGSGQELKTGAVGLIYGMDVFYSNAISIATDNDKSVGAVYVPSACAFAAQQDVRVQSQYDISWLGTKVTADIIYGMKLLDESGDLRGLQLVNLGG
jgi:hypothetical protein